MREPLTGNRMTTACICLNRRTYSVMIVWLTSGGVKYRSYIVVVVVPGSFLTVGMYDQKGIVNCRWGIAGALEVDILPPVVESLNQDKRTVSLD